MLNSATQSLPYRYPESTNSVAAVGPGWPAFGLGSIEVDVPCGAGRVVSIEHGFDRTLTFVYQAGIEALFGDALALAEQVQRGFLAGTRCQLQGKSHQFRIGVAISIRLGLQKSRAALA